MAALNQQVCTCCLCETDPVSCRWNSAPEENRVIQRWSFTLTRSKSSSPRPVARARSPSLVCPAASPLLHPSPPRQFPPPSYPRTYPSAFVPMWLSPKRIQPTSTRKKKPVLFSLMGYASEVLGSMNIKAPENMALQTLLEAETGKRSWPHSA